MGTKERIVGAAVRLFNERGTATVSTNHIAEEAGISPGNLYYHFRNKEEIIRAIFGRMMATWESTFELPQDRAPTLADLRGMLEETYLVFWEYRFFYREFVALLRRDPELGRSYREVREGGLANTQFILGSFVEGGILREPENPKALPELAKLFWLIVEFWLPFVEMIFEEAGGPARIQTAPKFVLWTMGLFNQPLRETIEMLYEFEEPFVVDHSAFEQAFGMRATPLRQAIAETVIWYRRAGGNPR